MELSKRPKKYPSEVNSKKKVSVVHGLAVMRAAESAIITGFLRLKTSVMIIAVSPRYRAKHAIYPRKVEIGTDTAYVLKKPSS